MIRARKLKLSEVLIYVQLDAVNGSLEVVQDALMTLPMISLIRRPSVVVVEDDPSIVRLLRAHLERDGYAVHAASSLSEAKVLLMGPLDWNLAILDRRLPDGDGVALSQEIRKLHPHRYLLMLTADSSEASKIEGFEGGVDDYVTKPFTMPELLARVRAGLRIVELQTALVASNQRLEQLSFTDGLTSLKNRRAFEQEFAIRFEQTRRYGRPLSVAIIDIDWFKSVNDGYGHPSGDAVLCSLARTIQNTSRQSDFVARVGGEEFAVILPETSLFDALQFAEKIRANVASANIEAGGVQHRMTVSIGVANVPHSKLPTAAALFNAADQALYRAKNRGRNRVECEKRTDTRSAGSPTARQIAAH